MPIFMLTSHPLRCYFFIEIISNKFGFVFASQLNFVGSLKVFPDSHCFINPSIILSPVFASNFYFYITQYIFSLMRNWCLSFPNTTWVFPCFYSGVWLPLPIVHRWLFTSWHMLIGYPELLFVDGFFRTAMRGIAMTPNFRFQVINDYSWLQELWVYLIIHWFIQLFLLNQFINCLFGKLVALESIWVRVSSRMIGIRQMIKKSN